MLNVAICFFSTLRNTNFFQHSLEDTFIFIKCLNLLPDNSKCKCFICYIGKKIFSLRLCFHTRLFLLHFNYLYNHQWIELYCFVFVFWCLYQTIYWLIIYSSSSMSTIINNHNSGIPPTENVSIFKIPLWFNFWSYQTHPLQILCTLCEIN